MYRSKITRKLGHFFDTIKKMLDMTIFGHDYKEEDVRDFGHDQKERHQKFWRTKRSFSQNVRPKTGNNLPNFSNHPPPSRISAYATELKSFTHSQNILRSTQRTY